MDTSKGEVRRMPVGSKICRSVRKKAKQLVSKRRRQQDKRELK